MSLIERLRNLREQRREYGHGLNFAVEGDDVDVALDEAAAELEANAAEIGRKDAALEKCFTLACDYSLHEKQARSDIANIARAALNKQESGND